MRKASAAMASTTTTPAPRSSGVWLLTGAAATGGCCAAGAVCDGTAVPHCPQNARPGLSAAPQLAQKLALVTGPSERRLGANTTGETPGSPTKFRYLSNFA